MATALAVSATLLAGSPFGAAGAAAPFAAADELQARVDEIVAAGAPGAALVVRDGSSYEALSSGLSDVVTERELLPDDRFRAGSVTKTFVATLALQLVDTYCDGAGSIDTTQLPELSGVTIR